MGERSFDSSNDTPLEVRVSHDNRDEPAAGLRDTWNHIHNPIQASSAPGKNVEVLTGQPTEQAGRLPDGSSPPSRVDRTSRAFAQRALSIEISMPNEATTSIMISIENTIKIRVDKPKQARDHKTSATNDKPTPGCEYKEMGEGHDKYHGAGWEDMGPWIKIQPPACRVF
jgi:hypothetical protein